MHLRKAGKHGKMTERFAEEYSEYGGFYMKPGGKCGNPSCGHYPIYERHIVRNPVSGDVKEIGSHCYQRWRQLQGIVVVPWFWQYLDALREQALSSPGTVIVPKEQRKIYEQQRKKWLIKHKILWQQEFYFESGDVAEERKLNNQLYSEVKPKLLEEHMNEYVVIARGRLLGFAQRFEEALEILSTHTDKVNHAIIDKIGEEVRVSKVWEGFVEKIK